MGSNRAALRKRPHEAERAEEELRQSAQRLRAMFENVALGIVEVDHQLRIVDVNERLCRLLGYRKKQLLGMSVDDLTAPEDRPRSRDLNTRMHEGLLDLFEYEKRYLKSDGSRVWVHVTVSAVRDASGQVDHGIGTVEDITARKSAEAQVQELNASLQRRNAELDAERMRWRGVVEGIADELWICDAEGKISLVNLPDATAMGLEEFGDKSIEDVVEDLEIMYPDGRPRPPEEAPLLRSLRTGEIARGEELVRVRRTGKMRHRQFSCAPMRDAAGSVTGAVAIVRDITENKRTEQALREADRRKDEFLAVLSHELRNPLAPIHNSLHVLDHADPDSEQARRARETIERQVDHMTRLIGDLLDVSRISRGKIHLHRERLDLREVVSRTIEDHRSMFESRGVALNLELPEAPLWIDADPTRLAQALGNLLQNAARFTPNGGGVFVRLVHEGSTGLLSVRDTGIGIAPELMPQLFEPFTQADRSLERSSGGLGLGLSLVKGLVLLHGGEVSAHSEGPGRGAEITIRLPALVEARAAAPDRETIEKPSTRRVLVIEDNVDSAESLRDVLELDEHEVAVAFTGPEGLAKAREIAPDIVFCDIGLPGMDGYGVARELRADPRLRSTFLVALSGYALEEDIEKAKGAGFDRHIAKPPTIALLRKTLAEARPD